jgi:hypothetical protein
MIGTNQAARRCVNTPGPAPAEVTAARPGRYRRHAVPSSASVPPRRPNQRRTRVQHHPYPIDRDVLGGDRQ